MTVFVVGCAHPVKSYIVLVTVFVVVQLEVLVTNFVVLVTVFVVVFVVLVTVFVVVQLEVLVTIFVVVGCAHPVKSYILLVTKMPR